MTSALKCRHSPEIVSRLSVLYEARPVDGGLDQEYTLNGGGVAREVCVCVCGGVVKKRKERLKMALRTLRIAPKVYQLIHAHRSLHCQTSFSDE